MLDIKADEYLIDTVATGNAYYGLSTTLNDIKTKEITVNMFYCVHT